MNQHEQKIEEMCNTYLDMQEKVFDRPKHYFEEELPLIKSVIAHCYFYLVLTANKKEES